MARFNLAPLPAPCACVKKKSGTVCRRGRFVAGTVHGRGGRFVAETIRGGDGLWQGTIHGGDSSWGDGLSVLHIYIFTQQTKMYEIIHARFLR